MGTDLMTRDGAELETDPVQYMAVVLNRAKEWLSEAQSIDEVRQSKAVAIGYESVIREKELAFDAQLSATEIVRRCERRIGELVREGQHEGTIAKRGQRADLPSGKDRLTVTDVTGVSHKEMNGIYAVADAPAEQFEQAIVDAREDGNLSRANVVRKVKGEAPKKERHYRTKGDPEYKKRHFDPERVLLTLTQEMETMDVGLEHLEPGQLEDVLVRECVTTIRAAWGRVNRHLRRISA
jgi:hypothetical protein